MRIKQRGHDIFDEQRGGDRASAAKPSRLRNRRRCAIHIAARTTAPIEPELDGDGENLIVRIDGLTTAEAPLSPEVTWRRNCSGIEPVPWPITGAVVAMVSDLRRNSRCIPVELLASYVRDRPQSIVTELFTRARRCGEAEPSRSADDDKPARAGSQQSPPAELPPPDKDQKDRKDEKNGTADGDKEKMLAIRSALHGGRAPRAERNNPGRVPCPQARPISANAQMVKLSP